MIIDVHAHLLNFTGYDHLLAQSAKQAGIAKMVLTGGPRQYDFASNEDVLTASERYPDPAITILDPSFAKYRVFNAGIERLATGMRWSWNLTVVCRG